MDWYGHECRQAGVKDPDDRNIRTDFAIGNGELRPTAS